MKTQNPFEGKNLRSLYDPATGKWWFSAVDVYAMLAEYEYEKARTSWNRFRFELEERENQLIRFSNRLKFPGRDGKYYFTEVLDTKEVIYLIQIIPSPNATPYRIWVADLVASGTCAEELLVQAGKQQATEILGEYESNPEKLHERLTVTKKRLV